MLCVIATSSFLSIGHDEFRERGGFECSLWREVSIQVANQCVVDEQRLKLVFTDVR